MKKLLFLAGVILISSSVQADTISLTKDQYKNLDKIDAALREKYAQFKGFNGTQDNLEVIGLPAAAVADEIGKFDFVQMESEKVETVNEEGLIQKRIRKLAIDSLKADGVKLKHIEGGE